MLLWKPSPDQVAVFFILAAGWGIADGILMTQLVSKLQNLFIAKNRLNPIKAGYF